MAVEMKIEENEKRGLFAEITEAELKKVVGGTNDHTALSNLISTVLKDLHDVRSSIIRNVAG